MCAGAFAAGGRASRASGGVRVAACAACGTARVFVRHSAISDEDRESTHHSGPRQLLIAGRPLAIVAAARWQRADRIIFIRALFPLAQIFLMCFTHSSANLNEAALSTIS